LHNVFPFQNQQVTRGFVNLPVGIANVRLLVDRIPEAASNQKTAALALYEQMLSSSDPLWYDQRPDGKTTRL